MLLRDGTQQVLGTQKSLALLCYLAVRGEAVSREQLSALLWPDSDADRARRSLRGELARLRSLLPAGVIDGSRFEIRLDTSAIGVDVRRFRALVTQERDTEAAELFRGSFCEGLNVRGADPFDDWLVGERHVLETTYVQLLRRLIRKEQPSGEAKAALEWARRGIAIQPLNEDFYVQAMEAAEQLGDRPHVLKIYRDLQTALQANLGIGPCAEARAIAGRASDRQAARPTEVRWVASGDPTDFVGHAHEKEMLKKCQQQAASGAGSLVFVHGPAGVGKTRLVREALERQRAVWCRAQPASSVAYLPIAAGLREYLSQWGVPAVKEVWLREAARVCPELSRAEHNTSLGAPEDKVRLVEGLAATLAGAVGKGGMLVFDHVESADPDTIAVLGDLIQGLPRLPLVVVVIDRTDFNAMRTDVADLLTAASRMERLVDVPVGELSGAELRALVRSCLGSGTRNVDSSGWVDEFADLVFEVLGGNPFSAIECSRLASDACEETPSDPFSAVKSGIPDVVRARITSLPRRLRQLAEAAATIGEPIVPDLLGRILDIGPWELADALDELVARRILVSKRGAMRFVHHLVAEVTYDSLASAKREMLHERAAQALISANSLNPDPVSGQIAAHFEASGKQEAAIPYHERAAETARTAHAHQMAIHHYQRLRELIPAKKQVPLLLRLGEVLSYAGTTDAEAIYREALQLATLQGAGREQAQCYFALGVLSRRRADLSGSRHALSKALRRFQVYGDQEGMEKALEALTYAHIQEGSFSEAISSAKTAAEIARDCGRLSNLGSAQLSLGIAHLYGGNYIPALESFEHARDVALDTGDELAQAEALRYLSAVYGADGRLGTPEQAWAAAERAIEICAGLGHRMGLARAADGLGGAYLVQGDWARALDCYMAGLNLKNAFGYAWGFDAMVYRVGYTLLQSGETDAASRVLRHAMALSRSLNAPYWLCRTLLALAELGYDSGDTATAKARATEALALAKGLQHHDFISTATVLLGSGCGKPRYEEDRVSQSAFSRSVDSPRGTLPDIPLILEIPVNGPKAIIAWLEPIINRLLSSHDAGER